MQRSTTALADTEFDVLIIGGGAFGAAAAYDAALRGLRTALIERTDFGAGASAECFKMVHGGIRYLQHADIRRLRASCHERSTLLRIAPHLVAPLPIAIPTYGYGRRGRAFLGAGAAVYDVLTCDRNRRIRDPQRRIENTGFLSRSEVRRLFPHLDSPNLSGAVVFQDGQMYNPARVVLAFVKAAARAGATVCNYVEAQQLTWRGDSVCGVQALDRMSGETFDVRATLTLNAAGPWADYLLQDANRFGAAARPPFSRDAYFIIDRAPTSEYGVAVEGLSRDKDALLSRATRHLFAAPWRDKTLIGVWHRHWRQSPDLARVEPEEIERWVEELNSVNPRLELSADETTFANCGLVPFGDTATETELSFGKESRIVDHRKTHRIAGLVTLVGVRFTTARADAARALDVLLEQHARPAARAPTDERALPGGDVEDFSHFVAEASRAEPTIDPRALNALLRNHGAEYKRVLDAFAGERSRVIAGTATLCAELSCAVEQEMAMHIEDVVMRRTDIASGSYPGRAALEECANLMAQRLGWSAKRTRDELDAVERSLSAHLAREPRRRTAPAAQSARPAEISTAAPLQRRA